jgi:hypothetical protein
MVPCCRTGHIYICYLDVGSLTCGPHLWRVCIYSAYVRGSPSLSFVKLTNTSFTNHSVLYQFSNPCKKNRESVQKAKRMPMVSREDEGENRRCTSAARPTPIAQVVDLENPQTFYFQLTVHRLLVVPAKTP